jgi:hypothetical protein
MTMGKIYDQVRLGKARQARRGTIGATREAIAASLFSTAPEDTKVLAAKTFSGTLESDTSSSAESETNVTPLETTDELSALQRDWTPAEQERRR